mmetsp:Transcript_53458/g.153386  ORF Transcript_53458/g.153386 Transcript_53458/m.153386 type:complete len:137 (-) Transcript_53458:67-477(-)
MDSLRGQLRQLCACRARRGDTQGPDGVGAPGAAAGGGSAVSEDVDVELLAGVTSTSARPLQHGGAAAAGQSNRCIRCRKARAGKHFCQVAVRSIYDVSSGSSVSCRHGPYCGQCQKKLVSLTLSSCACRAMIQSWL